MTLPSIAWRLDCYETLGSTSDHCRAQAEAGVPEGLAVLARRQTAGRGTRGRQWADAEGDKGGNLALSFLLRPSKPAALLKALPFLCAVALHDALIEVAPAGASLTIKWPNDILRDGNKLAGILIESDGSSGQDSGWIVVGIGANLASAPVLADRVAASLADAGPLDPVAVASLVLRQMTLWLGRWSGGGLAGILPSWLERAHPLGARVVVAQGEHYIAGFFAGLDEEGGLLLQTESGELSRFVAGEVLMIS